jgi:hypothetical protein
MLFCMKRVEPDVIFLARETEDHESLDKISSFVAANLH